MSINLAMPEITELKPKIIVLGVGGAGGNAVNNMVNANLLGVDFVVANTDAQALAVSSAERRIQLGAKVTRGLGAGSRPEIGQAAAEEAIDLITEQLTGAHMAFVTAGMGGGTGTGAAPVIARAARELGILTVGVVTKPFQFEGAHRAVVADRGIESLQKEVDTLIVIPNQNLFRIATEKTTFADAFGMADDVLHSGVRGITDLMVMPGLINLDFADVKAVIDEMGKAMMGTGEAEGERRAIEAAEAAISNPLLDDVSMKGARGVLINITGGMDLTLFEVDEAANRIRSEVDPEANIIIGSTFDEKLNGHMRVSVFATGIDAIERPVAVAEAETLVVRAAAAQPMGEPADTAEYPADERLWVVEPAQPAALADATDDDDLPLDGPGAEGRLVDEPFIAPTPMDARATTLARERDGLAAASSVGEETPKPEAAATRGPSLIDRMRGNARKRAKDEKAADTVAASHEFGKIDPADRIRQQLESEDQLEIPAFLRRQAN